MRESITVADLRDLLLALADDMIAAKDSLTDLDSAIGDGDLGVTMTLGFRAVTAELGTATDTDLYGILRACSMAFSDNAASTFGALMATMFLRASRVVKGKDAIGAEQAAAIILAAAEGVQQRGGAALGDKTVLDALIPAGEAMSQAAGKGATLAETVSAGLAAARAGAERTVAMRSRAGRSGWLGDRTVGVMDPGAEALVLMFESVDRFVRT